LRQRREDIALLVRHYVGKFAQQFGKPAPTVVEDTMAALTRFDWPGNVRQLINVVQQMVVVAEGDRVEPRHLPDEVRGTDEGTVDGVEIKGGMSLDQIEKHAIREALRIHAGNREQ